MNLTQIFTDEVYTPANIRLVTHRIVVLSRDRKMYKTVVEDLVADTFIRAWKGLSRFKRESTFQTWLYRITTNVFYDWHRKQEKYRHDISLEEVTNDGERALFGLPDKHYSRNPFKLIYAKELAKITEAALSKLPPHQRLVLEMKDKEGMRHREISPMVGTTELTSKNHLFRARRRVRLEITKAGVFV